MELSWPFSKFVIKSKSEFSGVTFQSSLSGVEEIFFLLKWQIMVSGQLMGRH